MTDAVSLMKRAREASDPLDARLLLAAAVQRLAIDLGVRVVVSGGTAVDLYAAQATGASAAWPAGWQASHDVDIIALESFGTAAARRDLFHELERQLGFRTRWPERTVVVPEFPFGLEIIEADLNLDPRAERVMTVRLETGDDVTFRGPEDTVLAYAESGYALRHDRDWERALAVYAAMRDRIDHESLREVARQMDRGWLVECVVAGQARPEYDPDRHDVDRII